MENGPYHGLPSYNTATLYIQMSNLEKNILINKDNETTAKGNNLQTKEMICKQIWCYLLKCIEHLVGCVSMRGLLQSSKQWLNIVINNTSNVNSNIMSVFYLTGIHISVSVYIKCTWITIKIK